MWPKLTHEVAEPRGSSSMIDELAAENARLVNPQILSKLPGWQNSVKA